MIPSHRPGSISLFVEVRCREGMAPRRILLGHGKAEASFAHSKRFAQYDGAVPVGASRCEGATEPRGSVWSARSLLPLWLVPRQHALWNRQDCKGEKLFLFQVQCKRAGRSPISARSKIEMLPVKREAADLDCGAWALAATYAFESRLFKGSKEY